MSKPVPPPLPPKNFHTLQFEKILSPTAPFVRLSKFIHGEPYFGKTGRNRFDDYMKDYGTCYVGQDLSVAVAETILHDENPVENQFDIPSWKFENHFVYEFDCSQLRLLDFTDTTLKRLGGTNELSGTGNFEITKQWSRAIFEHPARVDGFVYVSRHLNRRMACVLFDRAKERLAMTARSHLSTHQNLRASFDELGIVGI